MHPYLKSFVYGAVGTAAVMGTVAMPSAMASDHNDGPRVIDPANHAGDITDIYSFREIDQSKKAEDKDRVVLVMTTDGLLPPGTTHPFDPAISYEFHIARGAGVTKEDMVLDFRFGAPDGTGAQQIWLQGKNIGTTSVGNKVVSNAIPTATGPVKVFAGPRDDPFFLDLQVIRCGVGCATGAANAVDSFGNSNVSAIVMSAPVKFLQGSGAATVFGIWGVTRK